MEVIISQENIPKDWKLIEMVNLIRIKINIYVSKTKGKWDG